MGFRICLAAFVMRPQADTNRRMGMLLDIYFNSIVVDKKYHVISYKPALFFSNALSAL